jgi:succinoglycan biosynthesis protein ExoA
MQTAHINPKGATDRTRGVLFVIPTLNEEAHIAHVLDQAAVSARRSGGTIVVVDGGSTDRTRDVVEKMMEGDASIFLMHNPLRFQSAGINAAVDRFGSSSEWLIRLDAHASYPDDYCEILLREAEATGADSVVVTMKAAGTGFWQRIIADAQNDHVGNGGSQHRTAPRARFVEHGHHGLMRLDAFRAVGGYDPTFSHNEDAELDARLIKAGYRIWLTDRTVMTYYPRGTLKSLARQYLNFGRGRARTALKHPRSLRTRHGVLISLAPAVSSALLTPLSTLFFVPLALWLLMIFFAGLVRAVNTGAFSNILTGMIAGVMQISWSSGFWLQLARARREGGSRHVTAKARTT